MNAELFTTFLVRFNHLFTTAMEPVSDDEGMDNPEKLRETINSLSSYVGMLEGAILSVAVCKGNLGDAFNMWRDTILNDGPGALFNTEAPKATED